MSMCSNDRRLEEVNGTSQQNTMFPHNEENYDPNPNILNATELTTDLVPKLARNKRISSTKAVSHKVSDPPIECSVKSNTNRTKAKEYIVTQQKKRLLEKKTATGRNNMEKDEIKKRLERLHKDSLKIVKKNVAKKQRDIAALVKSTENIVKDNDKNAVAIDVLVVNGERNEQTTSMPVEQFTSSKSTDSKGRPSTTSLQLEINVTPRKRGILRRNEIVEGPPPSSESQPHLDKTIMDSLLKTVEQRNSVARRADKCESLANSHEVTPPALTHDDMRLKIPQSELKSSVIRTSSRSRSRSLDRTHSSTLDGKRRTRDEAKMNIPYWLRPSTAHAYPYNFIMAVRKKLESVTNPILVDPVPINKSDTPLARPKIGRKMNPRNFRENLNKPEEPDVVHDSSKAFLNIIDSVPTINDVQKLSVTNVSDDEPKMHENILESKQPFSGSNEYTNFSSISLHIQDRNTISELSSIHSEQPHHLISPTKNDQQMNALSDGRDDDTTISSAILSQSSPEKKSKRRALFVQPLSTEGIDDLKIISSNSNLSSKPASKAHAFINTQRGNLASQSSDQLLPMDLDNKSMVEMFETFSKNLSQVISVNERLHSALSRQSNLSVRDISSEMKSKSQKAATVSELYENHNADSSERKEKSNSHSEKIDTEKAYSSSFEPTNVSTLGEVVSNSVIKTETDHRNSNNDTSQVELKELSTTKTISEEQSANVVVTTTIDTQTVTSRKTEIIASDSGRSIDPEFRRFSDASSIVGSDIFAVFTQSDEENSLRSLNPAVLSEESFNYSSIGMFDQLINNEKQKSDHLAKLMKIREKSLIDRTKGQIAWLELQKQKYKEKGLTDRISAVKKKQRALLCHMAAERANIVRLSKLQQSPKSQRSSSKFKFQNFSAADVNVRRSSVGNELSQRSAFRAYEIDGTTGLEEILRKREDELRKRRNHVEHLIQWHQRLNREENDLIEMERVLMTYTGSVAIDYTNLSNNSNELIEKGLSRSPRKIQRKMKKIENIEKSLQLLHDMSSKSVASNGEEVDDVVEASGKRLNKLWRRLTGENTDKFNVDMCYKLNKYDLEKMYEDAKIVVINKFSKHRDIGSLMDQSQSILQVSIKENTSRNYIEGNNLSEAATDEDSQALVVPLLDLNFSRESISESLEHSDNNERLTNASDSFYFNNVELTNTLCEETAKTKTVIDDTRLKSDQDNTQADSIPFDNNSVITQNSFEEVLEDISCPNLQDVTSLEHSIPSDTNEQQTSNESNPTKAPTTSQSENVIISDNAVMAQECDDKELSDEFEEDNTVDNLLTQQQQSSSDETSRMTKSNHTMLSSSEISEEKIDEDTSSYQQSNSSKSEESRSIGLEQRLIDLDDSLKELSEAIDRAPVMEINCAARSSSESETNNDTQSECSRSEDKSDENEVKMVRNKIINETFPTSDMIISAGKHDEFHASGKSASLIRDYVSPASELKMPDIISEAEVLRRQQLQIEQESKHIDQSVPVVFLREIPNKPPPPYVPPAHGSHMTTIPPSDEKIKEIVYRRISELYNTHVSDSPPLTEKSHSILADNVTNVYERIIMDVCRECITELEIDQSTANSMKFKQPLAFYNPPNRLEYVQEFALKKIKKLLNPITDSGRASQMGACVKRQRDLVDELLVMEMMDDESKWSNFDLEEKEVIENIVEQIVFMVVNQAVDDAATWRQSKPTVLKNE